jgi:hypothetical protein
LRRAGRAKLIATRRNTHEIAAEADPFATVVYVDNDLTAISHGQRAACTVRVLPGALVRPQLLLVALARKP